MTRKAIRINNRQVETAAMERTPTTTTPWYTVAEAMAYLKCGETTIYRMLQTGVLQCRRLNGQHPRFTQQMLDACMLTDAQAMRLVAKK